MTARAGTEVEAANLALGHLGQNPITSLDDNTRRARAVRTFFASVRDAVLQKHNWNFATGYVTPAMLVAPNGGWPGGLPNRFNLPDDCLKVRFVDGAEAYDWEVMSAPADPAGSLAEVKILASRLSAPKVCYTRRIATVRLWSGQFLDAFAHELASAVAPMVTGSSSKADSEGGKAKDKISDAALEDGKEHARRTISRDTSWLGARGVGGARRR
ncbi:hypothetical protein ACWX0K_10975 [Nitrobacteraceae bacterium UC4446_H13]